MAPDANLHRLAAIRNGGWMVRNYPRSLQRAQRAEAIRQLGLICRAAFNATDDFEPIFQAIVDGLIPKEEPRF